MSAREQGWIIAGKRRDGGSPWFTKALGTTVAAYVYWTREDADKALGETVDSECYAVFPVEVMVGSADA